MFASSVGLHRFFLLFRQHYVKADFRAVWLGSRISFFPDFSSLVCKAIYIYICCCSSVAQLCLTLCNPMDCSVPGFPVLHCLPESAQTHVHWVGNAIQWSHPLSPASPPALSLSQLQGLFQWVSSSHQVARKKRPRQTYLRSGKGVSHLLSNF